MIEVAWSHGWGRPGICTSVCGPPGSSSKKVDKSCCCLGLNEFCIRCLLLSSSRPTKKHTRTREERPKSLVFLLPREEDHLRTRNQDRRQRTSSPTSTLDLEEIPESWAASSLTKKAAAAAPRLLNTSDSANVRGTDQALRLFGNFLPLVWTHVIYIDVLLKCLCQVTDLKLTLIMIWFIYPSELP